MSNILQKLKGGDLRSIGRADEVVDAVLKHPVSFGEVFQGMLDEDPLIRMRSADVCEKVSSKRPEYLQPFKDRLINEVSKIEQQEVHWHVAQMFSYLKISKKERNRIIRILLSYIDNSKSRIVKVCSIQTLADLAEKDESIRSKIVRKLEEIVKTGSPAMISRGKKLIERIKEL